MQNESKKPEAPAEKKPRRRLTPEERIAERKAEIAAIEARQRERVREQISDVEGALHNCRSAAMLAGMEAEAKTCLEALRVLTGTAKLDPEES